MNIFYLDSDVKLCAAYHVSKHVVKMITEHNQLLSTAHRVLDGEQRTVKSNNRNVKRWILPDSREGQLYLASHVNHPSAIWVRKSSENYKWLWNLTMELCKEYTYRYGKVHKAEREGLLGILHNIPDNIVNETFTEPTPAMPSDVLMNNSIDSYRNYYMVKKRHIANWNGTVNSRDIPEWFK